MKKALKATCNDSSSSKSSEEEKLYKVMRYTAFMAIDDGVKSLGEGGSSYVEESSSSDGEVISLEMDKLYETLHV